MTKNSHYVILLYDILNLQYHVDADVVELADTQDLGSCALWRAGSSPVIRTQWREAEPGVLFQESVRRGGKLRTEITKNKSVRA